MSTKNDTNDLAVRAEPLLLRAKKIYGDILDSEHRLKMQRDELLMLAFRLGGVLVALKEIIGHGRWILWIEGHWPELGKRNCQRCMSLYRDNDSKCVDSTLLDAESVRKFLWGYIPAKERPELDGDQPIAPHPHPLTFVNNFTKWDRQAELGLIVRPPVDVLQRDLEPVVRRIVALAGRDWVEGLLT